MYIDRVPNRNSRPTILLRYGTREGKKVRKTTVANITHWPERRIWALERVLKDEPLMTPEDAFKIHRTWPHGHVQTILAVVRKIGLDRIIAAKRCRERDLVLAMIVERLLHPCSKLGTTRLWHASTLAQELGVEDADEDELYCAMDWLLARQTRIEKKLAARHLSDGAQVLCDVTSSYFEGRTCPLARLGKNRDGKKGKSTVVYCVLADREGRAVAVDVFPGNTGDPTTLPDQVDKIRRVFGLTQVVLVGDRGLLTQTRIDALRDYPGLGWISALRSKSIRDLIDGGSLQLSLFDEQRLAELTSPDFPDERLVACYNPLLAAERKRKREELLQATERCLERIAREAARRTKKPLLKAEIGQKVGRVINRYKVAKHFEVEIDDGVLKFARRHEQICREQELDGIYVVRTSESSERLSAEDTVRSYKNLGLLERVFQCLKSIDILVRPIRHRLEERVRAHIFLCLLAYYIEWHLRKILAPVLFHDEELDADRKTRDPVLPAEPSPSAKRKKNNRQTEDGLQLHSFGSLMAELATLARHRCTLPIDPSSTPFTRHTEPTALQQRVQDLLEAFPGYGT